MMTLRTTWALVAASVAITGCGSLPVLHEPIEVPKPFPVPCIDLVDVPVPPPSARAAAAGSTDPFVRAQSLLVDLKLRDGYILQLEAALSKCIKKGATP